MKTVMVNIVCNTNISNCEFLTLHNGCPLPRSAYRATSCPVCGLPTETKESQLSYNLVMGLVTL
jgi:hypothetical protein